MRIKLVLTLLVVFLFCFESLAEAQGRRGGQRAGVSRAMLAQVELIQKELEVTDEQKASLAEMQGARRGQRGEGRGEGKGKRGEGKGKGGEGKGGEGKGRDRGARGERGQRRGGGGQSVEQVQAEIDKLSEVLLDHQMARLSEIYVQVMGQRAIQDPVIAEALEITEDQKSQMQDVQNDMREEMRSLRDTVEREEMREKMTEMTSALNEKMMGVLSDGQKEKLDEMKGEEFDLPEDAMPRRGGRRGGGRGGDRSDF